MRYDNVLWELILDKQFTSIDFRTAYELLNGNGSYLVVQGLNTFWVEIWRQGRVTTLKTAKTIEEIKEMIPWKHVKRIYVATNSDTILFEIPKEVAEILCL